MRLTALFAVPLLVLAALPATAAPMGDHDECANELSPGTRSCLRFNVDAVNGAAADATGDYLYLWIGTPAEPGATEHRVTSLPTVAGVLYAEANGADGLQRDTWRSGGKDRAGDQSLLV